MTGYYRKIVSVIICFLVYHLSFAYEEVGVSFRSYEVRPDKRTSLLLPAEPDKGISFSRECIISFDVRIESNKDRFGYICRTIIDGESNIDILLNSPYGGSPFIGIVAGKYGLIPCSGLEGDLNLENWRRITIVVASGDSLRVSINGNKVMQKKNGKPAHTVSALFGAVAEGQFATSDVAPMIIRNLSVGIDGKERHWALSSDKDLSSDKRIKISAANPIWRSELNRKWLLVETIKTDSKTFVVPDMKRNRLFVISRRNVICYDLDSGRISVFPVEDDDLNLDYCTNNFHVSPDGSLNYIDFDLDLPMVSRFDAENGCWTEKSPKTNYSRYLHSCNLFNDSDSSFVQMCGYGYHAYYNDLNVLNLNSGDFKKTKFDISPRYLAASGICDGRLLLYGGKGNENGRQELGVRLYNDLYEIDLHDYSVKLLWSLPQEQYVAARHLVPAGDGEFMALTYNPGVFPTELCLRKFSVADGQTELYADAIPYEFIDVESDAGLVASNDALFAYVLVRSEDGYAVRIYRINTPVCRAEIVEKSEHNGFKILVFLVVVLAGMAGVIFYSRRRRFSNVSNASETEPDAARTSSDNKAELPLRTGVRLLGGFKVVDRNHKDISESFTPLMKQLFSLIILYSGKRDGISNVELKEILWDDKSNESFNNNRAVNFKKIRDCLAEVGNVNLVSRRGRWCVVDEDGLCDWLNYGKFLDKLNPSTISEVEMSELIAIAGSGQLLPEMRYGWLDPFKAKYSETVMNLLSHFRDADEISLDMRIVIADLILEFDSLDEDSIRVKCKAYIKTKRLGSAQKTFVNFTEEYEEVMGEKFGIPFKEFVRED